MSNVPLNVEAPSLFEWHARLIERAATTLAHFISTTDPEKLSWKPTVDGQCHSRPVYEQIEECINVNLRFASLLKGEKPEDPTGEHFEDPATSQNKLLESANILAGAVRGLDDTVFTQTFETRMGSVPGSVLMELPLANMHYHAGQVNMVQLLCGDETFHVPPSFME